MSDDLGYLIKMDLDPSGRYLVTSCSNKCVYIWDTNSSECLASLCGHGEIVTDLKFSSDGSHLYTISGDRYTRDHNFLLFSTNDFMILF